MTIIDLTKHPKYKPVEPPEMEIVSIEWNDNNYMEMLIAMTKDLPKKEDQ